MGIKVRMFHGHASAAIVAVAVTAALAGCSMTSTDDTRPTRSATATATADTVAENVRFADSPDQSGLPSCAELLPAELISPLVPDIADDPLTKQPHIDPSFAAPAAAGGLSCSSDNGVSPLDSSYPGKAGDPVRSAVDTTVLPDASAELDAYLADGVTVAPVACNATDSARLVCSADVHAGSAWLAVALERPQDADGVTPEAMLAPFQALVKHVTAAVKRSSLATKRVQHAAQSAGPSDCVATRVSAVTTTPLVDTWGATDYQVDLSWSTLERTGSEWCSFNPAGERPYASTSARYGTLPGGSWAVRARIDADLIDTDDRIALDGLGKHDAAYRTCDDTLCTVDVVHDGDWTEYLLKRAVAPDASAAIEAWARSSFHA